MLDVEKSNLVQWMVVNIPGADVGAGQTIAEYNSPTPDVGGKPHR